MTTKTLLQIKKFTLVGVLNTVIDFGAFNLLIFYFGLHGINYILFKSTAFILALINSYLWNKQWVFRGGTRIYKNYKSYKEMALFFSASLLGLFINALVSFSVFMLLSNLPVYIPTVVSANIGAIVATIFVLTFNFTSYKFIVFAQPI